MAHMFLSEQLYQGYRLLACDSSDVNIACDPSDERTFIHEGSYLKDIGNIFVL